MLVGGTYRFRAGVTSGSGSSVSRPGSLRLASPSRVTGPRPTGIGGMFIAEADSPAAAFEATGTFADLLESHVVPVMDIMEAVPINARVFDWIDSVS